MRGHEWFAACAFALVGIAGTSGCTTSSEEGEDATDPAAEEELKSGTFECTTGVKCRIGKQYCAVMSGGARPRPGQPPSQRFSCEPLPAAGTCRTSASCDACFPSTGGTGKFCSAKRGNLTLHTLMP